MWRKWRPVFRWGSLCPVVLADPAGFLVVMSRAQQPVEFAELSTLPDAYPSITAELKPQDYGHLFGRLVAVDYGLPDTEVTGARREYYEAFLKGNRPHFNGEQDA